MVESKVPLKWVLVMLAVTVLAVSSVAAVTPLGENMNALAAIIATDVTCSQCVGTNSDGTNDIKDGSVTNAKLASSAVTNGKIASSAVTNSKIASNAVTSSKIAAGGVANSDIASNAVTNSKIADGTIGYADVSRTLIAVEHRDDCNCGGTGCDPDGNTRYESIYDSRITPNSVVSVTGVGYGRECGTYAQFTGVVAVTCDNPIPNGMGVNYAIFSNPAYS